MKRDFTIKIYKILDQWIPPFLRDSKLFMKPLMKIVCGNNAELLMNFKDKYPFMGEKELNYYYNMLQTNDNKRNCDLNSACLKYILENINENPPPGGGG